MTIHNEHPFQPAEPDRNPVRRLRGRLPAPVSVITTGQDERRAGLTVSSLLVVDGEPAAILAILDPLSDLRDGLQATGTAVVNLLGWRDHQLAEAFGYQAPAPGGPFRLGEWEPSEWGPVLASATGWAGCRLSQRSPVEVGWGLQVQLDIEQVAIGRDDEPLVHHRGRYRKLS
ncbi:MAG: flavin reductase family protein [Jatrophihabitantaceae bacterium]